MALFLCYTYSLMRRYNLHTAHVLYLGSATGRACTHSCLRIWSRGFFVWTHTFGFCVCLLLPPSPVLQPAHCTPFTFPTTYHLPRHVPYSTYTLHSCHLHTHHSFTTGQFGVACCYIYVLPTCRDLDTHLPCFTTMSSWTETFTTFSACCLQCSATTTPQEDLPVIYHRLLPACLLLLPPPCLPPPVPHTHHYLPPTTTAPLPGLVSHTTLSTTTTTCTSTPTTAAGSAGQIWQAFTGIQDIRQPPE